MKIGSAVPLFFSSGFEQNPWPPNVRRFVHQQQERYENSKAISALTYFLQKLFVIQKILVLIG
jgi:hypothetical protein